MIKSERLDNRVKNNNGYIYDDLDGYSNTGFLDISTFIIPAIIENNNPSNLFKIQ